MLRKLFYFGVGLASLAYDNFDELARIGEERYNRFVHVNHPPEETIEVEEEEVPVARASASDQPEDDLTIINGIGPTFAKRLQEAGITTYNALAGATAEQVKEVTGVAEWQADPQDWIAAAGQMA
jgi:predicted flap endonuclease-1-like 5' DNA nuclease